MRKFVSQKCNTNPITFQINGTFANALNALFQIHYIFNLEYAREMFSFYEMLEAMSGTTFAVSGNRCDLYHRLKMVTGNFEVL